jgi:hypothetical protein
MHKKLGPLQLWQWLAVGGAVGIIYYLYEKHAASSSASTAANQAASTAPTGGDTLPAGDDGGGGGSGGGSGTSPLSTALTGIQSELTDPTTGLPYSTELSTAISGVQSENSTIAATLSTLESNLAAQQPPTPTTTGASSGATSGGGKGSTITKADIAKLSIATQIDDIKAKIFPASKATSAAQKIYKAGGISKTEATAAAVKKATQKKTKAKK